MSWFLIALIAPLIWSIVNHVDKYLISKYFHGEGIGGLMIFVGIVSMPFALAILYLYPEVFSIPFSHVTVLVTTGIIYNFAILFYLYALEDEDASLVVPFWQLSPVFAYILGVVFLGEYLTSLQMFGSLVVLLGAIILSLELGEDSRLRLKRRAVIFMALSSLCIALENVVFKKFSFAEESFFWISVFWNQVGMIIFAIGCYMVPTYRASLKDIFKKNSTKVLGLNILEQVIETIGSIVNYFALFLAPAALITLVTYSAQPMFVFILGLMLTLLFPRFIKEDISKKNLAIKFISILIMAIGVYFVTN